MTEIPEPGWYPDQDVDGYRYFDGLSWGERIVAAPPAVVSVRPQLGRVPSGAITPPVGLSRHDLLHALTRTEHVV